MNNQNNFFDFTADAVGFINEIRRVTPEKSKKGSFIALKVAILEGENGENRSYCDLIARGAQAVAVLETLEQEWPGPSNDGGPNWLASLRIGSLYAKAYTSRKGEAKAVLGGRLLAIKWLKIGDERIDVPEWRSDTTAVEQEQQTQRPQPQQPRNQPQPQRQTQTPPQREDQGKSQDWQQQSQRRPQHPPQRGYQEQPQRHQRQQYQPAQNPQRGSRYQEEQSQFA